MLAAWLALSAVLGLYVPLNRRAAWGVLSRRQWRIAHRHRHGRENCPSARISDRLYRLVKIAGRYRCVYCGTTVNPQLDHYRAWSLGGFTSLANLMVLCGYHNRVKSNYWPGRYYKPMEGADNIALADLIWRAERRARRGPVFWLLVLLVSL
jgi:5-methylcytosine-specific restriction endonuclease McrA